MPDPISRGVGLLHDYLERHELSPNAFCAKHPDCDELERSRIIRILKGERTRIGVRFAKQMHEATGGEVPWDSWAVEAGDAVPPHTASDFAVDPALHAVA